MQTMHFAFSCVLTKCPTGLIFLKLSEVLELLIYFCCVQTRPDILNNGLIHYNARLVI